jgi:hypothetical protein
MGSWCDLGIIIGAGSDALNLRFLLDAASALRVAEAGKFGLDSLIVQTGFEKGGLGKAVS